MLALLISGCQQKPDPIPQPEEVAEPENRCNPGKTAWTPPQNLPPVVLNDKTLILSEEVAALLVHSDATTLVFRGEDNMLREIAPGTILVSTITPTTPYGILRKVTSIRRNGSEYHLSTVQAKLDEALDHADFEFNDKITPTERDGWYYVIQDNDGNPFTIEDNLTFEGESDINWFIKMKINAFDRHLKYEYDMDGYVKGTLTAGNALGTIGLETEVVQVKMAPEVIVVFGFPFVFTPIFNIVVGVDGYVEGDFTIDSDYTFESSGYIQADCGEWSRDGDFIIDGTHELEGTMTSTMSVYAGPEIRFQFFDWEDAAITGGVYPYLEYSYTNSPEAWQLNRGVRAAFKAEVSLFSWFTLIYSPEPIFDVNAEVAHGNCPNMFAYTERTGNTVAISAKGGTAPYKFRKGESGPYNVQHTFTGLSSGWHNFYVKDNTGCEAMKRVKVN